MCQYTLVIVFPRNLLSIRESERRSGLELDYHERRIRDEGDVESSISLPVFPFPCICRAPTSTYVQHTHKTRSTHQSDTHGERSTRGSRTIGSRARSLNLIHTHQMRPPVDESSGGWAKGAGEVHDAPRGDDAAPDKSSVGGGHRGIRAPAAAARQRTLDNGPHTYTCREDRYKTLAAGTCDPHALYITRGTRRPREEKMPVESIEVSPSIVGNLARLNAVLFPFAFSFVRANAND